MYIFVLKSISEISPYPPDWKVITELRVLFPFYPSSSLTYDIIHLSTHTFTNACVRPADKIMYFDIHTTGTGTCIRRSARGAAFNEVINQYSGVGDEIRFSEIMNREDRKKIFFFFSFIHTSVSHIEVSFGNKIPVRGWLENRLGKKSRRNSLFLDQNFIIKFLYLV